MSTASPIATGVLGIMGILNGRYSHKNEVRVKADKNKTTGKKSYFGAIDTRQKFLACI